MQERDEELVTGRCGVDVGEEESTQKYNIQIPIKLTENPIFLLYFCRCSYIFWSLCAGQTEHSKIRSLRESVIISRL